MTFRQWIKYHLYGRRGVFPYFGVQVHFPKFCAAFRETCLQGVFESENVGTLQRVCRPNTCMFDVGSNLGLMAVPILASVPGVRIVSFEPSPNNLPWLEKTIAQSAYRDRWTLLQKAAGASPGRASFSVSEPGDGVFDGLKATNRASVARQVEVEITTLDLEWQKLGSPQVSLIKIDVEGAELGVLQGSELLLQTMRPAILIEWSLANLPAYEIPPEALFTFAQSHGYLILAMPGRAFIPTAAALRLQMNWTESYLMIPNDSPAPVF